MRLVLTYDSTSPVEAHVQIFQQLRRQIVMGQYRPGELLPTNKAICEGLGVSPPTVQRAYTELAREGLVKGSTSLGTQALQPPRQAYLDVAQEILDGQVGEALSLGLTRTEMQIVFNALAGKWFRMRGQDRRKVRSMEVDQSRRRLGRRASDVADASASET